MSDWDHPMCWECWEYKKPGQEPFRVKDAPPERCCFCGQPAVDGIYVREPRSFPFCAHPLKAS